MPASSGAPRRIGILGGTFDPIHIGHLILAEEARFHAQLDEVLFVPARVSPLKLEEGTHFTDEERLEMVKLAIRDNPHFRASRVDLDREAPSYTVDTLRLLRDQYGPQVQLYFLMGMDSLVHLQQWYKPAEIARLAHLIVMSRPGYSRDLDNVERTIPGIRPTIHLIEGLEIGISSTEIRRRLSLGLPIRYQVPSAVQEYIAGCAPPEQIPVAFPAQECECGTADPHPH